MKRLLMVVLWVIVGSLQAQTNAVSVSKKGQVDFSSDLAKVTADLKTTFDAPPAARTNLDENLKAIKALILKHYKDGNREQLARLYLLDAHVYADGLTNSAKAMAIWRTVVRDFPGTVAAQGAAISLRHAMAQQAEAASKIPEGLQVGQRFPAFNEHDAYGHPLALSAYRGRVTLIDFWATWCPPCRAEMPNVIATYNRFHSRGFDIIGVSLDGNKRALVNFTRLNHMPWQQYFDGQEWKNKLAVKYGVQAIPMCYLLDRHGVIIAKELRGHALSQAVAKALNTR